MTTSTTWTRSSAALSRRCLQNLLVAKGGAKKKDLADQIDEVVNSGALPISRTMAKRTTRTV